MTEVVDSQIPFVKVRRVRSFDEVTSQIRQLILSGQIGRGQRLPGERELCELLDVSRPTLREALRSLEAAGMVEIRPGKNGGAYATGPSEATLGDALATLLNFRGASTADLAEFRASFEAENAWWAARRATPEEISGLKALIEQMRNAANGATPRWEAVANLDAQWHEAVARASHNRVRIAISLGIREALLRNVVVVQPGVAMAERREIPIELVEVTTAIESHDPQRASESMRRHVEHWVSLYPQVRLDGARPGPIRTRAARMRKKN